MYLAEENLSHWNQQWMFLDSVKHVVHFFSSSSAVLFFFFFFVVVVVVVFCTFTVTS